MDVATQPHRSVTAQVSFARRRMDSRPCLDGGDDVESDHVTGAFYRTPKNSYSMFLGRRTRYTRRARYHTHRQQCGKRARERQANTARALNRRFRILGQPYTRAISITDHRLEMEAYLKKAGAWNTKKTLCRASIFTLPLSLLPLLDESPPTTTPSSHTAPANSPTSAAAQAGAEPHTLPQSPLLGPADPKRGLTCRTCGLVFDSPPQQHAHFKTDAHVHALRRRARLGSGSGSGSGSGRLSSAPDARDDESSDSSEDEDEGPEGIEEDALDPSDGLLDGDGQPLTAIANTFSVAAASADMGPPSKYGAVQVRPYDGRQGVTVSFFPSSCGGGGGGGSGGGPSSHSLTVSAIPLSLPSIDPTPASALAPAFAPAPAPPTGSNEALWPALHRCLRAAQVNSLWAVLLLRSGKFAGIIVDGRGTKVLLHKCYKRYTVRAKAGGSQSSHDNKGGAAHSAGAAMRRAGELALQDEVTGLVRSWAETLEQCACVLVSAPKVMRSLLYDGDKDTGLLCKDDPRVVSVPFMVPKVTMNAALEVFTKCTTVFVAKTGGGSGSSPASTLGPTAHNASSADGTLSRDPLDEIQDEYTEMVAALAKQRREARSLRKGEKRAAGRDAEGAVRGGVAGAGGGEEAWTPEDALVSHVCGLLRAGRGVEVEALLGRIQGKEEEGEGGEEEEEEEGGAAAAAAAAAEALAPLGARLQDTSPALLVALVEKSHRAGKEGKEVLPGESYGTLLHVAAESGAGPTCRLLLLLGADPGAIDSRGRVAYGLCRDKETRDCFRRARAVLEGAAAAAAAGGVSNTSTLSPPDSTSSAVGTHWTPPRQWDWDGAGVGPALSEDLEALQAQQQRDKVCQSHVNFSMPVKCRIYRNDKS